MGLAESPSRNATASIQQPEMAWSFFEVSKEEEASLIMGVRKERGRERSRLIDIDRDCNECGEGHRALKRCGGNAG